MNLESKISLSPPSPLYISPSLFPLFLSPFPLSLSPSLSDSVAKLFASVPLELPYYMQRPPRCTDIVELPYSMAAMDHLEPIMYRNNFRTSLEHGEKGLKKVSLLYDIVRVPEIQSRAVFLFIWSKIEDINIPVYMYMYMYMYVHSSDHIKFLGPHCTVAVRPKHDVCVLIV